MIYDAPDTIDTTGQTDASADIQSAIDAAVAEASADEPITFRLRQGGTYRVDTPLRIPPNMQIVTDRPPRGLPS